MLTEANIQRIMSWRGCGRVKVAVWAILGWGSGVLGGGGLVRSDGRERVGVDRGVCFV